MAPQSTPERDGNCALPEPKYHQLARHLASRIAAGEFAVDRKMPDERELAAQCGVSRVTIRETLRVLESRGLIQRTRGKGTFVHQDYRGSQWFSPATTILLVQIQGNEPRIAAPGTFYGRIHTGVRRMARRLGLAVKQRQVRGYVRVPLRDYSPPSPSEVGGVVLSGVFDEHYIRMYQSEGIPVVVCRLLV